MSERATQVRHTIERLLELSELVEGSGMRSPGAEPPAALRFGDVAVALGFTSRAEVDRAVGVQAADRELGRPHRLIGEVLRDLGALSPFECDEVLDTLARVAQERRVQPTRRGPGLAWRDDLVEDGLGPRRSA